MAHDPSFPPKFLVPETVDVINVEMKIKNVEKIKNASKRWIKNVADICHESNY